MFALPMSCTFGARSCERRGQGSVLLHARITICIVEIMHLCRLRCVVSMVFVSCAVCLYVYFVRIVLVFV